MDERIKQALQQDHLIDITTTGRKSGRPRRIEIWFHEVNGRLFITGQPGKRGWYANLLANPACTFHLKESVQADLPARAVPILDEAERREILTVLTANFGRQDELEAWVAGSRLVELFVESLA